MVSIDEDVLVVGCGLAGLSLAAALRLQGIERFLVLEQGSGPGAFWAGNYERIMLHSPFHDLPRDGGMRRRYGTFLRRNELLRYLSDYAELHRLQRHLRFGHSVVRIARGGGRWRVETDRQTFTSTILAIATSATRKPIVPHIEGRARYRGVLMHSRQYRNATPFRGKRVLLVGSGNSAAEIALDLVTGGAQSVDMWVRGPRYFLPLFTLGRVFRALRFLRLDFTDRAFDAGHRWTKVDPEFRVALRRRDRVFNVFSQDLSAFGIRRPREGAATQMMLMGRVPVFDQGTTNLIRSGRIGVIDGNERPLLALTESGAALGDDERAFDAVILATGFEPGLSEFLDDHERLCAMDEDRRVVMPITDGRCRSAVEPTLFFPGFDLTTIGGLSLGRWGFEVGARIAEEMLGTRTESSTAALHGSAP